MVPLSLRGEGSLLHILEIILLCFVSPDENTASQRETWILTPHICALNPWASSQLKVYVLSRGSGSAWQDRDGAEVLFPFPQWRLLFGSYCLLAARFC